MSVFSNPVGTAGAAAAAYIAALLQLLGDQNPLAVQGELLGEVRRLVGGLSGKDLLEPEAPGKWSILEVVSHLVDQELVNSYRLRAIVAEDEPVIQGYDQDRWFAIGRPRSRIYSGNSRRSAGEISGFTVNSVRENWIGWAFIPSGAAKAPADFAR